MTTQSDVGMEPDGFKETGSIEYADRGKVFLETVGLGTLSPSPVADLSCGAVVWRITGGEGKFQGASEYITSNFAISAPGEAVDNNYARILLP